MLPRNYRLRKERDFRAVFARPRPVASAPGEQRVSRGPSVRSSELLTVHVKPRRTHRGLASVSAPIRFGFSISKKVSKRAHDRNRIKRRLSEIARRELLAGVDTKPLDCVVVARQPALNASFAELRQDFLALCERVGIPGAATVE